MQSTDIQHYAPFNKGERIIIVHAGSKDGSVNGAQLIFKSKSKSGDYHNDMNFDNFRICLENQLIPNLPPNSVVVLDNASYHSKQEDKCPTQATKKADIQAWLKRKGVHFTEGISKAELLHMCDLNKSQPKFVVEKKKSLHFAEP